MKHRITMRPNEVAGLLGVTRQHVYNLVGRGDLRLVRSGGASLIPVVDVYAHLGLDPSSAPPVEVASFVLPEKARADAANLRYIERPTA